jgi:pimeloyl-ACP methyl ester carboxylesterase
MSDVGHPVLDFGVPYRRLLRLLPDRVPLGTLARFAWPLTPLLARVLSRSIAELGWYPGNADVALMRALMLTAVDDLPASLLREFARWYDTKAMSDRYGMFDFTEHLERITVPILIIAGGRDALTPVRDLEHVYNGIASADKVFRVIGRQHGDAHDYSHADLILGLHAPDDVYPVVLQWLEAHRRSTKGRPARRTIAGRAMRRRTGRSLTADAGAGEASRTPSRS